MATIYNSSRNALLKKIGLSPDKKAWIFFISAALITIPLGTAYNSIAIIAFVLYMLLSARKEKTVYNYVLFFPVTLFVVMVLSISWSIDANASLKALGKEASLLFVPIAFMIGGAFKEQQRKLVLRNYSIGMCLFGLFYLGRAIIRYMASGSTDVFFYHELSTKSVNAIYLSAMFSIALYYFVSLRQKKIWTYIASAFMMGMIVLLSSKTIIIIDVLLVLMFFLFYSGLSKPVKTGSAVVFCVLVIAAGYFSRIRDRIQEELTANTTSVTAENGVHSVSINEAWNTPRFEQSDYFNGTAFRIYQIRIFKEMLAEDNIFFTGYGLNVSRIKIEQKGIENNVFTGDEVNYGYNKQNFHNQYVETFADLGVFGLVLLILMLAVNFKNAFASKDFIHIAFAILMIALLLTESFLWRQRGVVLFVMFYCLFNGILLRGNDKEKYEKNIDNRGGGFSGIASL